MSPLNIQLLWLVAPPFSYFIYLPQEHVEVNVAVSTTSHINEGHYDLKGEQFVKGN